MKILIFSIALVYLTSYTISAQIVASYEKGLIIKKNGDTIKCLVPLSIYYSKYINYRMGNNSQDIEINLKDVSSLITPYNRFENILIDNKQYMMCLLINGKVNLYSQVTPDEGSNPNGGTYLYKAPVIIYALKKDDAYFLIKRNNYKKLLSDNLIDCPDIQTNLGKKGYQY